MTVSKRKTAQGVRYRWDFEFGGQRYNSPVSYGGKREATRAEKAARKAAEAGAAPKAPRKRAAAVRDLADGLTPDQVTLKVACDRYWNDRARHLRSASDIERRLAHVKRLIGEDTLVVDIRFATVSDAVNTRRDEPGRFGKVLTAAGVNRDVIDALRPALYHAGRIYELPLRKIDWKELRLKEAGELVCEFSEADVKAWGAELATDAERLYLATALTYGQRRGELFFPPSALKRGDDGPYVEIGRYLNRARVWRDSRKDGSLHEVALDEFDADALAAQAKRAIAAGCPHLWVDDDGQAISYYAMGHRLHAAAARAGIVKDRLLHGMRHHAGTMMARKNGGSLHLAMVLLGHKKPTTTTRYAHVAKGDVRRAIERTKATPEPRQR